MDIYVFPFYQYFSLSVFSVRLGLHRGQQSVNHAVYDVCDLCAVHKSMLPCSVLKYVYRTKFKYEF